MAAAAASAQRLDPKDPLNIASVKLAEASRVRLYLPGLGTGRDEEPETSADKQAVNGGRGAAVGGAAGATAAGSNSEAALKARKKLARMASLAVSCELPDDGTLPEGVAMEVIVDEKVMEDQDIPDEADFAEDSLSDVELPAGAEVGDAAHGMLRPRNSAEAAAMAAAGAGGAHGWQGSDGWAGGSAGPGNANTYGAAGGPGAAGYAAAGSAGGSAPGGSRGMRSRNRNISPGQLRPGMRGGYGYASAGYGGSAAGQGFGPGPSPGPGSAPAPEPRAPIWERQTMASQRAAAAAAEAKREASAVVQAPKVYRAVQVKSVSLGLMMTPLDSISIGMSSDRGERDRNFRDAAPERFREDRLRSMSPGLKRPVTSEFSRQQQQLMLQQQQQQQQQHHVHQLQQQQQQQYQQQQLFPASERSRSYGGGQANFNYADGYDEDEEDVDGPNSGDLAYPHPRQHAPSRLQANRPTNTPHSPLLYTTRGMAQQRPASRQIQR